MRILYIAGFGRSGSTLLAQVLGQVDGVVSVGELHHIWRTGALESRPDELCGCGQSFARCAFWDAVLDDVFERRPTPVEIGSLRRRVDRIRYIPLILAHRKPRRFADDLAHYRGIVRRLYAAVARVGGGDVVVDSGKDISPLFVLATLPEIDVRVVHLVRDPRGVSFSWSQPRRRRQFVDDDRLMATFSPVDTAMRWTYTNVLAEVARRWHPRYLRVRYEDFVSAPQTLLARIGAHAGLDPATLPRVTSSVDVTRPAHIVSGNPMRFDTGSVTIRLDDRWQRMMPTSSRVAVGSLTWPLRRRYGYRSP